MTKHLPFVLLPETDSYCTLSYITIACPEQLSYNCKILEKTMNRILNKTSPPGDQRYESVKVDKNQ